jgi:hypothetical protein
MNESTQRVTAHQANQPQNKQDHKDRPKHIVTSGLKLENHARPVEVQCPYHPLSFAGFTSKLLD